MMMRLLLFSTLYYVVVADDDNISVTTELFPPGCKVDEDIDEQRDFQPTFYHCNRRKVITEKAKIERCEVKDRWHLKGNLTEFQKNIKRNDKYSLGRFLNLTKIEHCNVTRLIKSCTDTTDLLTGGGGSCKSGQKACDLKLPADFTGTPTFEMKCPEEHVGEAVAEVSETVYLWDPAPLPPGLTVKYHLTKSDLPDGSLDCAESELKKVECSTPSSWETLKEKCAILKKDDIRERPTCNYKVVALLDAPVTARCMSMNTLYPVVWNYEDMDTVDLLSHFTVETLVLTTEHYAEKCELGRWRELISVKGEPIKVAECITLLDKHDPQHIYTKNLKRENGQVKADFSELQIPFGEGGFFEITGEHSTCGENIPKNGEYHFQITLGWARMSKESVVAKTKLTISAASEDSDLCELKIQPAATRQSFEKNIRSQCDYDERIHLHALEFGTATTERKSLEKCENHDTTFIYKFNETELNYFDQLSSVGTKDLKLDNKYGAFLTVWNVPTDCEIMTESYGYGVEKYGCDASRWTSNVHYHKGQTVFSSQVFGFTSYNPIGIRFKCPDTSKERDFSKMEARLTSIMALREPIARPKDWIIEEDGSTYDRHDKKRVGNAKRVKYVLKQATQSCDLKTCNGLSTTWSGTPSQNSEVEGYYPWDFECSDLFKSKECKFTLQAHVSVSGQKDKLNNTDPQLYMCLMNPSIVRIVWEDMLAQFAWNKYKLVSLILDDSTKCSNIEVGNIDEDEKINPYPAGQIKTHEACAQEIVDETVLRDPKVENGKRIFSVPEMTIYKGLDIVAKNCTIGKSEVTVVLEKSISAPIELYGVYGL